MLQTCLICEKDFPQSEMSTEIIGVCVHCVQASNESTLTLSNQENASRDFMNIAERNEVEAYERQIGEPDASWTLWLNYSSMYPAKKPNLRAAAEATGLTYANARHLSAQWQFALRLQHYKQHIDDTLREQRANHARNVIESNLSFAQQLRDKVAEHIHNVPVMDMKDLQNALKIASELEKTALTEQKVVDLADYRPGGNASASATDAKEVKVDDMSEILKILGQAGQLNMGPIGVEHTTTTTTRVIKGGE